MMSLTAREATQFIYRKEGGQGFMRGFTPGTIKNTMNNATYFSMLYYLENMIRDTSMFNEGQVAFLASAGARTV